MKLTAAATLPGARRREAGALADDMRIKRLYDLAYVAALDDLQTLALEHRASPPSAQGGSASAARMRATASWGFLSTSSASSRSTR